MSALGRIPKLWTHLNEMSWSIAFHRSISQCFYNRNKPKTKLYRWREGGEREREREREREKRREQKRREEKRLFKMHMYTTLLLRSTLIKMIKIKKQHVH